MNISVADSGFYRFGLGYADRDEFVEKYDKIYNRLEKKYFTDEKNPYSINKRYSHKEYLKEKCEKLPLEKISDYSNAYRNGDKDGVTECKPSQIILKFQVIPYDEKNIIKQYTDGKNKDMYAVLNYDRIYPFEMICDTMQLDFNYHARIRNSLFSQSGHYKKMFAVGLYKGDYKIIVETLSHTPETAEILTLLFIERDNYGKMHKFDNELK